MLFLFWFLSFIFNFRISESLTEIAVELGQNVTLNCSFAEKEIYWFVQRNPKPPVHILRSLGTLQFSFYNQKHKEFKEKYSLQTSGRLFIHSVTRNELGSYYCARVKDHLIFSNGTRLKKKADFIQRSDREAEPQLLSKDYLNSWMFIPLVVSCSLNCVLITLLLAVVFRTSTKKKKNISVKQPLDPNSLQYSDIILTASPRPTQSGQISSTYAKLQLPARSQSCTTNI